MPITLLEAGKLTEPKIVVDGLETIAEVSPILKECPFTEINSNTLTRFREKSLAATNGRAVNEVWTRTQGANERYSESLVIHGGEVYIDNFEVRTMGNLKSVKLDQFRKLERSMAFSFSEQFFEGDSSVNGRQFDGLRKRLSLEWPNQIVSLTTGGAMLNFDALDDLIAKVIGPDDQKRLYMSRTVSRIITSIARAWPGHALIDVNTDALGKQVMKYNGVPIHIIERTDNQATILAFDEFDGTASYDTASIYCVRYGSDYLQGIRGTGSTMTVHDFGEIEAAPGYLGRIEAYWGLNYHHPRSAARLRYINNVFPDVPYSFEA